MIRMQYYPYGWIILIYKLDHINLFAACVKFTYGFENFNWWNPCSWTHSTNRLCAWSTLSMLRNFIHVTQIIYVITSIYMAGFFHVVNFIHEKKFDLLSRFTQIINLSICFNACVISFTLEHKFIQKRCNPFLFIIPSMIIWSKMATSSLWSCFTWFVTWHGMPPMASTPCHVIPWYLWYGMKIRTCNSHYIYVMFWCNACMSTLAWHEPH